MRWRGLPALIGSALVLATVLSACGNDGLNLARQACGYVERGIHLYERAQHETDGKRAENELQQAAVELEDAIPLAAQANSADPQWNPLMTTLQEVRRNDLSNLVPALRAQCHQASLPNEQPPPFNNVPQGGGGAPPGAGSTAPSPSSPSPSSPSPSSPAPASTAPPAPVPSTIPNPKLP